MHTLSRRPWIISLFLVLALSAWVVSGSISNDTPTETQQQETKTPLPKVRTRWSEAQAINRSVILYGRTEPNRAAALKAEVYGKVIEVLAPRGGLVNTGDPILKISIDDREAQLAHAKARLAQHKLEYEGATKLSEKGYQGKTLLAEKQAMLKESQALVVRLSKDINNTIVKAPFNGVMIDRYVEVGDYLAIGDDIAQIADLDPLIVKGDVSQSDITHIHTRQQADIRFPDGTSTTGRVRYVSSLSDVKTNTFRIEVNIDNPEGNTLGGLSAEIEIPLEQVDAIKISPALLALDESGTIGVKWVKDGIVGFTEIDIVRNDADGTWIKGLGNRVQLITVGQAFVRKGDPVEAVLETKDVN
ncbi:MAG: efflux RND transporter periplasmic adaptor subunit [bacterium]